MDGSAMLFALLLFAAKTALVIGGLLLVVFVVFFLASRNRNPPSLEIERLDEGYTDRRRQLQSQILAKKDYKSLVKKEKKTKKSAEPLSRKTYVVDFKGDLKASQVENLREEISAILLVSTPSDEVVVRIESPGGLVNAYGLAAAQLQRLRDHGLHLTVCVDEVAASGGYMMACVAQQICAAPFAIVGSIGVVASLPNFHKLLTKNDIEYKEVTAGQYKRTVSILGEITESGMTKFKDQIEDTHELFKKHVHQHRPNLNMAKIATGEYWYGTQALALGLVDKIQTSDEYLLNLSASSQLFKIVHHQHQPLTERLSRSFGRGLATVLGSTFERAITAVWRARFGL